MALVDCLSAGVFVIRGDFAILGWLVTLAYGVTALTCLLCSHRTDPSLARFWFFLAIALLFLGVNKQLDLQTSLTAYGKCLSVAQGWYPYRRIAQFLFLIILLGLGIWVLIRALRLTWPHRTTLGFALAGILGLTVYVAGRAMGMYHVDGILGLNANFGLLRNLLEITALTAIFANAVLFLRPTHR